MEVTGDNCFVSFLQPLLLLSGLWGVAGVFPSCLWAKAKSPVYRRATQKDKRPLALELIPTANSVSSSAHKHVFGLREEAGEGPQTRGEDANSAQKGSRLRRQTQNLPLSFAVGRQCQSQHYRVDLSNNTNLLNQSEFPVAIG